MINVTLRAEHRVCVKHLLVKNATFDMIKDSEINPLNTLDIFVIKISHHGIGVLYLAAVTQICINTYLIAIILWQLKTDVDLQYIFC